MNGNVVPGPTRSKEFLPNTRQRELILKFGPEVFEQKKEMVNLSFG